MAPKMLTEILDWTGTILVLIAAFIFATKKATSPYIRRKGFYFFLLSNIAWIPMGMLVQPTPYGFMITQAILVVINIRGIFNCNKEINLYKNELWYGK